MKLTVNKLKYFGTDVVMMKYLVYNSGWYAILEPLKEKMMANGSTRLNKYIEPC